MKCDKCPASGNFNGCPCYFGKQEAETIHKCELTKRKIIKMMNEYEEENEKFYESYGG